MGLSALRIWLLAHSIVWLHVSILDVVQSDSCYAWIAFGLSVHVVLGVGGINPGFCFVINLFRRWVIYFSLWSVVLWAGESSDCVQFLHWVWYCVISRTEQLKLEAACDHFTFPVLPSHLTMTMAEDDGCLHGNHHTGFNQRPLQVKSIPDVLDESAWVPLNEEFCNYVPIDKFIV